MSTEASHPLYGQRTLEFVTSSLEYCKLLEHAKQCTKEELTAQLTATLPLIYSRAVLLEPHDSQEWDLEEGVSEETYEAIRATLIQRYGEDDVYLETFDNDMQYSDAPIAQHLSEQLADIYQDLANFLFIYREGMEELMAAALDRCIINFQEYWGQRLVNALRALHQIRYSNTATDNGQLAY